MELNFSLNMFSTQDQTVTTPPDDFSSGDFYIHFHLINVNLPSQTNVTNSIDDFTTTIINQNFWISSNNLCSCNHTTVLDEDNNISLYDSFSTLPIPHSILRTILPAIGAGARQMRAENNEGRDVLEMHVTLCLTTQPMVQESHPHVCAASQLIVDRLEKVTMHDTSDYSTKQCSICLEELSNEFKSELIKTKCFHIFHKDCIFQWFKKCTIRQLAYSCPLCRCNCEII
ncbi:hypothetical protein RYX36_009166 [Vicia faba]